MDPASITAIQKNNNDPLSPPAANSADTSMDPSQEPESTHRFPKRANKSYAFLTAIVAAVGLVFLSLR